MRRLCLSTGLLLVACTRQAPRLAPNVDWRQQVVASVGSADAADLSSLRFRPAVCDHFDLKPESAILNEASFVRFLQGQHFEVQAQRQQVDPKNPELHYVFVNVPGMADPVALRVAVLANADDAGRALYEALLQRGPGAWGVHRSNVAVLGPNSSSSDDIAFAATTKLACWGTFTVAGADDVFVIPGAYGEP
ncbi:MAG: hypothetical protein M3O36_15985 [Myxococcota bacterium]|nr:hypothetical protein [Myxococcota bacterium]